MTISGSEGRRAAPIAEVRAVLSASLRARLPEIEKEIFTRVRAVSPADVEFDPAYVEGLRVSVNDAIAYVIDGIEEGREPEPIPRAVRVQARRAVHVGLPLDTILRRYATGDRLITEFVMDEADSLPWPALQQILRGHGAHTELLILRVAHNCGSEYEWRQHTKMAERAGLSRELIDRVTDDAPADGFDRRQVTLLHAADELHHERCIAGPTWARLSEFLSDVAQHRHRLRPLERPPGRCDRQPAPLSRRRARRRVLAEGREVREPLRQVGLPLIVLVDTPGFMPGIKQEQAGVIRFGATLVEAFAGATVPRVTVVLRKAYGGAFIAMNSKGLGADLVFAWPNAEIGIMGADSAIGIIHRKVLDAASDPSAERRALAAAYSDEHLGAAAAAESGVIDEVIEPVETRQRLIGAIEAASESRL